MLLEVCIDNYESAQAATEGGAHRLEVCGDLSIGGVTPDLGLVKSIQLNLDIPIRMMIRPRGGDFVYSEKEYDQMVTDITIAKSLNIEGVVFGLLDDKGNIDRERTRNLVALAKPLTVTFHRAYDECNNPVGELIFLKNIGIDTILTSGLKPTAIEGVLLLQKLVRIAGDDITILPGSGVNPENLQQLLITTSAKVYHGSCKGPNGKTDKETVRKMVQILQTT